MVGPKRHFLPLLLLISVSALFLVSHYHASLPLSSTLNFNPNHNITLSDKSTDFRSPNFTLIIKLLAFNRLDSLSRCLRSLASADYLTDRVHLHVYIDHFVHNESLLRLDESHRILEFVDEFDWGFGDKLVHYRTGNVGLQAQWLEAWWPTSNNEFAFVVEDDLEVSPFYYKFLRHLIVNYYYNSSNFSPSIYGASLQRPRFVPGKHGNKIRLDSKTRLFLYQLVGTWGQLLFPKPWKEFRLWYDKHKAMSSKPIIEGMVTTGWYRRLGERIWTPWFIKFIHSHGYFNIYTNFLHERALSVSHRDAGVNYGKTAGPDSHLINEKSLDFDFYETQPLSDLKWYDFCFREVNPGRVITSCNELGSVLKSMPKQETVMVVSLFGVSKATTKNLICHLESLNIWNYLFLGDESDFLFDLARRGVPVIVRDQFLTSVEARKISTTGGSSDVIIKETVAKVFVIKGCLENGFNILLVNGNMLFLNKAPFPFLQSDSASDFLAGQRSEIFIARSSSSAAKVWASNVASNVVAVVESINRGSSMKESSSFGRVVEKLVVGKGVVISWIDEMRFGVEVGENNGNHTLLESAKKMVFWSGDSSADVIQKMLDELGLWKLDADFSCKAVVCNQS